MNDASGTDLLCRRWLHSHEEDTATERVYRPGEHDFPPSRGRSGFELLPGGEMTQVGIAPADGPIETTGRWRREGDQLMLERSDGSGARLALKILSIDERRLVVERPR
jgi:hypothetical protein